MNHPDANNETSTDGPNNRKRRLFGLRLMHHKYQIRFSLIIFSIFFAAALAIWFERHWTTDYLQKNGYITPDAVAVHVRLIDTMVGRTVLIGLFFGFVFAILFTHFVVGPIYRFDKTFHELGQGNLKARMTFRPMDEFQDVAKVFNEVAEKLREMWVKDRQAAQSLVQTALEVGSRLRKDGRAAEAEALEKAIESYKKQLPPITL